MGMIMWK